MNETQNKLLEIAASILGKPYKYAVPVQEIGTFFDCSSFTQYVYKGIGVEIPRSTILQGTAGKEITANESLQLGDLLFYRGEKGHYNDELFPERQVYIGHVAMYVGNDQAMHATGNKGVVKESLETIANEKRGPIVMIKRLI